MACAVVLLILVVGPATAKDHQVRLQITSYGDTIGWHFSKYAGPLPPRAEYIRIRFGSPIGNLRFTRILPEDDTNHRMEKGEEFDKTMSVTGPGVYVLAFPDWRHGAEVEVTLNVDGEDWFQGAGASKNMAHWTKQMNKWSRHVRQTGDREIAFFLD